MKKDEILNLYRYNAWANARTLQAAAQVTAEWIWRNRFDLIVFLRDEALIIC